MLKEALLYAQRGWCIYPCHYFFNRKCSCGKRECTSPAKHPLVKGGFNAATQDPNLIRKWWGKWPSANIGIATGINSNVIVIDVDPKNGGSISLQKILNIAANQEPTLIAQSGGHRDGRHYYYQHPGGVVRTIDGVEPGIDIKGDKGSIIAPPSVHSSGRTYRWLTDDPPAPLPKWVYHTIQERRTRDFIFSRKIRGRKIDVDNIPTIVEGERNIRFYRLCCRMIGSGYDQDETANILLKINREKVILKKEPPLADKYIKDMVKRLYRRYG